VIASSRRLENDRPNLALRLYPLNAEALVARTISALDRRDGDVSLEDIERNVRAVMPLNAGDARVYSLLGEILRRQGQNDAAYAMFDHALTLASTEIHALQWTISRAIETGDYRQAMERLDVLFRRWPERIGPIAVAVPGIFSEPASYVVLLDRIKAVPPWRSKLLDELSGDTAQEPCFAARLLQDLAAGPSPPTPSETARLLASLFKRKQYDLAYRTFLLTLAPQERDLSGFVFDSAFRQGPSDRRFDWVVRQQPGIVVSLPAESGNGSLGEGLSLEFNETPVLRIGLEQYVLLPPGAYEIEIKASAAAADLPKSLMWSLDCLDRSQPVLRADIPGGDYRDRTLRYGFSVPINCLAQVLTLRTSATAESWSNRYSGRILFHHVRISATQT